jgi:hypothetical protein
MNKLITSSSPADGKLIEVRQYSDNKFAVIEYNDAEVRIVPSSSGGMRIKINTDDAEIVSSTVWETEYDAMGDFYRTESRLCKTLH